MMANHHHYPHPSYQQPHYHQQQQQQQHQFIHQQQQQYQQRYEYDQYHHQQQQQQQQIYQQQMLQKQQYQQEERKRFLIELEFVQCLANPNYLHHLATQGLFKKMEFKNYLKYLLYWKRPEYIKFIKFPQCLIFLDLLQQDDLYDNIQNADCIKLILEQQYLCYKRRKSIDISDNTKNDQQQQQQQQQQNRLAQLPIKQEK